MEAAAAVETDASGLLSDAVLVVDDVVRLAQLAVDRHELEREAAVLHVRAWLAVELLGRLAEPDRAISPGALRRAGPLANAPRSALLHGRSALLAVVRALPHMPAVPPRVRVDDAVFYALCAFGLPPTGALGEGGFGTVLRCDRPGGPVAVKVMGPSENRDILLAEFAALRTIRAAANRATDPVLVQAAQRVVRLLGFRRLNCASDQPDVAFGLLVTPMGTDDLCDAVERGDLDCETSMRLLADVYVGMQFVHSAGLSVCDLKPENVLLQREAGVLRAVLIDFGITAPLGGTAPCTSGTIGWGTLPEHPGFPRPATRSHDLYVFCKIVLWVLENPRLNIDDITDRGTFPRHAPYTAGSICPATHDATRLQRWASTMVQEAHETYSRVNRPEYYTTEVAALHAPFDPADVPQGLLPYVQRVLAPRVRPRSASPGPPAKLRR